MIIPTVNGKDPVYYANYCTEEYFAHGATMNDVEAFFDSMNFTFSRASQATYIDAGVVKIAPAGVPRITSDGLILEGTRTNLAYPSSDFTAAGWNKGNVTVVGNVIAAPDGTMTADKVTETTGAGWHELYQGPATTAAYERTCVSGFLKAGTKTVGRAWGVRSACGYFADVDLNTGALGSQTAWPNSNIFGANVETLADGWYRNSCAGSFLNTNTWCDIAMGVGSYIGDGSSHLYVWGAQLEKAEFASSYIPTTSGAATREKDSLVRQYKTPVQAITKILEFTVPNGKPASGSFQVLYHLDNGKSTAGGLYCDVEFFRNSNGNLFATVTYNTATTDIDLGVVTDGSSHKVAFTASPSGIIASLDGATAQSMALNYPWPTDLIYERLGHNMDGERAWFGTLKQDATYLERASVAEIEAMAA